MQSLLSEPVWLPTNVIVNLNIRHTADTGENHALLQPEKLEGALMRPRNLWAYEDPSPDAVRLAVSYMEAIANAHAFEQGNKRTGFDAGFLFLRANGWDIHESADQELMAISFVELVTNTITSYDFETYLSGFVIEAA